MVLEITEREGVVIVAIPRRFDAGNAQPAEDELKGVIDTHPARLLFDFSGTDYIASIGMRVLLSTTRSLMKGGCSVAISSLGRSVKMVFEMAGFTRIFTVYGTRDEALQNLTKND